LLGAKVTDVDGNVEDRSGTVSVFDGPKPVLHVAAGSAAEAEYVGNWLRQITAGDLRPEEIAIFVRSEAEIERATAAVTNAGLAWTLLDDQVAVKQGQVSIGTMHLAKGLEFRAVAVMACDDGILPLEARLEAVADESDLEEVYGSERSLLYVACTRARDHLIVTAATPASEFLDDMASLA
jgi:superfamily I DNA/RNA helicase